ncbi:hypothetical protein SSX86_029989 [Deinandra increscens subsp. villosa]|uniref:Ubiquitin-like protease family profile domain-containing protein n=1 Tax=Deinandra increscens subsp. villosa TaxID=3103831 RepID=A0AAP0GL40_9ASTR
MGEKEVIEREKPRGRDEVVAEFKLQFPPESADRVLLVELTNFMKSQKDAGWMFTINFMVVFATIFGNTMKNSTVNKRFLNNIRQDADIKNYNWCEYLIKCLKRERRDSNGLNPFCGPLQFLAMLMVHDDSIRRKENIGILGVKYIKDSMLESIQTSLEAKIKIDEDDIEMKKKKKKNILNASRVLKEKPSQDTVESKTSNVRSEGDIESEKKKSNKRTISKKDSPRKKKMVDLDCTQNQITPTNECESQKNKRKNLDSDEGKQKKSKKGAYSENEISTSTKEISDDITPSLVMAFDKVDNELNSKKEKVKKAQSEIKPENEAVSDDFTPAMKLTNSVDDIVETHEQEIPVSYFNVTEFLESDEGKQKETSAQYDITPRMMLEFEKSEKTKDVRNEDISDDITPSLVMAFDKVDNEVNSKKDSKVVANEPVLSFGFSMIASPDKQDDFDKDLNSKKEKVESPHTETKQGENAEVSEKDDDFMMAKDSDEGKQKETSAQYDITPRMMLEFEKSEKTKDVRNEDISDDITPSLVMAFDKVDNEVNSKKDSKVVANEPVLSFGFSMIASPDKQDDFDKDLNSKKEKVESPHTETKQDSDEGKQKETTAKYDITPSLMLEFEKSEKPKDVRNEEISDDITPSLVMAFDKVDNELNSKKESKVIANEPVVSFGFSMISSPEKVKKTHAETKPEDEGNEVDVSKVIEITPFLNVDAEKTFDAENQQRPKRKIVLSDLLRSPYVKRPVQMKVKRTIFEKEMSDFIFSACYCNSDVVFTTATANEIVTRDSIQSLCPGVEIHLNVITAWARILNYQENSKNKESPRRLFCSPVMLFPTFYDAGVKKEDRYTHFESNFESVLSAENLNSLEGIDLVFIPIVFAWHYYLMCFNLKTERIELIDNNGDKKRKYGTIPKKMKQAFVDYLISIGYKHHEKMKKAQIIRLEMPWRTLNNSIDCGVFVMRHMKTYFGDSKNWNSGLLKEKDQGHDLDDLRYKYAVKILTHNMNLQSHSNVEEMKQYMKLEEDVRMLLKEVALERIQKRMKEHLDPIEKDEDLEEKKEDPNKKNEDPKKKNEDPKKKIEDAKKKNEDPKKKNGVPKKKNANPKEKNDEVKKKQKD